MAKFIITTDSSCDCAIDELKQKDIPVVFFEYADGTKTLVDGSFNPFLYFRF